jgi:hypothetical protein
MPSEMSKLTLALGDVVRPITDKEERAATDAALKLLSNELSQRRRVYGVELRIPKTEQTATPARYFSVVIGDYDKRRTLEVVVDSAGRLVSNTDLTGFQPPFVTDEVAEARKIAETQPIIAAFAKAPGGFVQAFGPHAEDAPERRLVGLRYGAMTSTGPRALAEVEVDLARQKLIRFEDIQALGGEN